MQTKDKYIAPPDKYIAPLINILHRGKIQNI